jgi:hypothetical protein
MPPKTRFLGLALCAALLPAPAGEIRFNRDIRPILSENCFACHGPDKNARKGKFRLDTSEGAYADREGKKPVVPGRPEESEVVKRLVASDADEVMPPPKTGKTLKPEQIQLLRDWISQGARYEGHWAFLPPQRAPIPEVAKSDWPLNPVDKFILARLEKEGLPPSPEADRRALIRRASLDLTGLPPTSDEVERFAKTSDPRAYEKLVDRLLASPHFGERMAVPWLDLVRYADTVGFHGDAPVSVWPYRDYVIHAFNENKRFDQFTREQLAGDLLPGATDEQRVASAFNRLNRMSAEGGIQDKEYLAKYAADRVRVVSTAWLGATMACCECHDHKYDPFLSRDFYSMEAFFADLKEKGFYDKAFDDNDWGPRLSLPNRAEKRKLARLDARIAEVERQMKFVSNDLLAQGRAKWEAATLLRDRLKGLEWRVQKPVALQTVNGATLALGEDQATVTASGANPDNETYVVSFKPGKGTWRALRLETLHDEIFPGNRVSRGGVTFIVTELEVEAAEVAGPGRPVALVHAVADEEGDGFPALAMIDGRRETGWGIPLGHSRDHQAAFHFARPLGTTRDTILTVRIHQDNYERRATIGRFKLAMSTLERPSFENEAMPGNVLEALRVEAGKRSGEQTNAIARFYRRICPELAEPRRELARWKAASGVLLAAIPSTLVSAARETPRTIRILPRGDWMNDSGEIVPPSTPRFLSPAVAERAPRATRIDLANWIVSPANPLTARAFVNRLWRMYFGTGIARTVDDLGIQGEWPTHPELIDWLAREFVDSGWDVKHVIRLIVTSRAYRQSAVMTALLAERDPQNRLIARQSDIRLDAEFIRDNALAISGLLADKIGGPSVRPYQPEGYYAPLNFPKREYERDRGAGLYRRALYTHWQRTFTHPALAAFDAPSREECVAYRVPSNTPLQALVLLNDPEFVEAARVFAANIIRHGGRRFETRLRWAFERALARSPRPEEGSVLEAFLNKELARYADDPAAAQALDGAGDAPAANGLNPRELAAWTEVGRAILNLHETITRD